VRVCVSIIVFRRFGHHRFSPKPPVLLERELVGRREEIT
jgi:hypothetical protein